MVNGRFRFPPPVLNMPPPIPRPLPCTGGEVLLSIWEVLMVVLTGKAMKSPPPSPAPFGSMTPSAGFRWALLFWMIQFVKLAVPLPFLVLNRAPPPPRPSFRPLLVTVTFVIVRLAVPAEPVSNSNPPPSPSVIDGLPRLKPFWMVRLETDTVAFVND